MSLRPIGALMLREIATTHGRSFGGYSWMILEPIAAVSMLSLAFSLFFANPPLGSSFPLFYASGYLAFVIYSDVAQKTSVSLRYSRPLLAYPVVNWFDALLARFVLALLTHTLICAVVLTGIAFVEDLPLRFDLAALSSGLVLAAGLGFSVGALNIVLFEFIPVWERVWAIVNRPLFLLSGVMFLPDQLPDPYRDWLSYNPLVQVISLTREGIYPNYKADHLGASYVAAISLGVLVVALILLGRHARGRVLNS